MRDSVETGFPGHIIANHKGEVGAQCCDCSTVGRIPGGRNVAALERALVLENGWTLQPEPAGWCCGKCSKIRTEAAS